MTRRRVLVAEDDAVSRWLLESFLSRWGFVVVAQADGDSTHEVLQREDAPQLVILDWMMPGMTGVEICRRLRSSSRPNPTYVIMLTSRGSPEDTVEGLEAGADDYICKPFNSEELRARIRNGARLLDLQSKLQDRVLELEEALACVKQLQGLLPICSYCKKIRSDGNYWEQVENYISDHTGATFSHGICPQCYESQVKPQIEGWEPGAPRP